MSCPESLTVAEMVCDTPTVPLRALRVTVRVAASAGAAEISEAATTVIAEMSERMRFTVGPSQFTEVMGSPLGKGVEADLTFTVVREWITWWQSGVGLRQ